MEWGTFIIIVVTLYVVYYGFAFLLDFVSKGRTSKVASSGVQYNIGSLIGDEEAAQVLDEKEFDEPLVRVHQTAAPDESMQYEQEYFEEEDNEQELDEQELDEQEYFEEEDNEQGLELEEQDPIIAPVHARQEPSPGDNSESVKMQVMGQPKSASDFLAAVRARAQENSIKRSVAVFNS